MSAALEQRLAEINREIRDYPTPIARCDAQLAGLLEERSTIVSQLDKEGSCSPAAVWTNDGGLHGA